MNYAFERIVYLKLRYLRRACSCRVRDGLRCFVFCVIRFIMVDVILVVIGWHIIQTHCREYHGEELALPRKGRMALRTRRRKQESMISKSHALFPSYPLVVSVVSVTIRRRNKCLLFFTPPSSTLCPLPRRQRLIHRPKPHSLLLNY
jgi:hypothetical protein